MINKWYQKVKVKNRTIRVLDFHALNKEPNNIWIILSERERQGKTTNAFQFLRKEYLEYGYLSAFIFNTKEMFNNPDKLISANRTIPSNLKWDKVIVKKNGLLDIETGEYFCYFFTLNSSHNAKAGTRFLKMRYLFYDEFNMGLKMIKNKQFTKLNELTYSLFSSVGVENCKMFIFGNTLSLNVPIFNSFGIKKLPEGDLKIIVYKKAIINLYCPKTTLEEREMLERNSNWMWDMSKLGGEYENSVIGDETQDSMLGVVPELQYHRFKETTHNHYIKLDEGFYVKLWSNKENKLFLEFSKNNDNANFTLTFKLGLVDTFIVRDGIYRDHISKLLYEGNLFFDSYTTKMMIISQL